MWSIKLFILLFLTLIKVIHHAAAFNVLAIVSLPLKSHYMAFDRLFRELAVRGHSVTVMNNYVEENPPANMSFVDLSRDRYPPIAMPPMSSYEGSSSHYMRLYNTYIHFLISPQSAANDCENIFVNKEVAKFLAKKQKFDVIFVEQFMSDCGVAFAAALYTAPIIGITSHTLLPWSYPRLGIPFDFSADAFYFSSGGQNPSLYHKLESYLSNLYMQYVTEPRIIQNIHEVFNKYLPNLRLDVKEAIRDRMKMMFVYQHFSVTGARLLPPQVLEIGGIHIREPKPIPQDIEKFLSSAKHGAIYVSFGSNLNASSMSPSKMQQFLDAFKKIPQKVLWKIESPIITNSENIMTRSWFPQRDVLCHPKVLAFISHGGMLSLSEAAHCGKPLLTIPFFGDQFSNSAAVQQSGLGATLFFDELDADSLSAAIILLTTEEMQQKAQKVYNMWHDRPVNVLDSAIYWTEYVVRHQSSPPSLPSKSNEWFQSTLLDVYSILVVIAIIFLLLLFSLFIIIKNVLKYFLSKWFIKRKKE